MSVSGSELKQLLRRIGRLWLVYFKGQLLLGVIVGLLTWVAGMALGLRWALVLGVVAGVLDTVPKLGPIVATVPAVVVALWQGSSVLSVENWVFALIIVGAYIAIQQIAGFFIEPYIVGKRLQLHPLVVLVAVIVGAAVANVVGAFLAIPLLVTVREVARYVHNKRNGLPPFPPETDEDQEPS
jgi:predicted PurR-regulated permease PerM